VALAATIGFFDGVHSGHQFVLEHLRLVAAENGFDSAVVIFEDHPQKVLRNIDVRLLTTFDERVELLKKNGINHILSFRFAEVQHLTAEAFMRLLHDKYDVGMLVMGYDHHFGCDQMTDFADYESAATRVGIRLIRLIQNPQSNASSTVIRKALVDGDVQQANKLLGYPYTLKGRVVEGRQIGRKIGFPTANICLPKKKLIPASGVYVCEVDNRMAILNIGTNPTVQGTKQTVELHIPNFQGDLYGKLLTIKLLRYLRPDRKFENIELLRLQIQQDVATLK